MSLAGDSIDAISKPDGRLVRQDCDCRPRTRTEIAPIRGEKSRPLQTRPATVVGKSPTVGSATASQSRSDDKQISAVKFSLTESPPDAAVPQAFIDAAVAVLRAKPKHEPESNESPRHRRSSPNRRRGRAVSRRAQGGSELRFLAGWHAAGQGSLLTLEAPQSNAFSSVESCVEESNGCPLVPAKPISR